MSEEVSNEVEKFLKYMQGRKATERTIGNYRDFLTSFFIYAKVNNKEDILNLTRENVTDYLNYVVNDKGLEVSTRNTYLIPIKRIFVYYKDELKKNIDESILSIDNIKPPVKEEIWLDDVEVYQLKQTVTHVRSKAIICLFFNTGIRVSELVEIRLSDMTRYEDDNGSHYYEIIIHGKGKKERYVYTDDETTEAIDKYMAKRRVAVKERTHTDNDYLFLSNQGNKMDRHNLAKMIKNWTRKINCRNADKMSPHKLRHTYCTHMLNKRIIEKDENGNDVDKGLANDIKTVSVSMGHSNLATTSRYAHTDKGKINNMQRGGY